MPKTRHQKGAGHLFLVKRCGGKGYEKTMSFLVICVADQNGTSFFDMFCSDSHLRGICTSYSFQRPRCVL